jgi:plasmid stabilization system protein ParE
VNRLVLAKEAEGDALEAFHFYEARREGLGERFRDHLGDAFGRVQASPEAAPVIYRDLRRKLIERFPYAILYRAYPGLVFVVAIMHAKQNPAIWKRRAIRGEPG